MKNTLNIDRLLKSKKNTINILTDGGQYNDNEYTQGTRYTGFISINGHGVYRQEIMPESVYISYLGHKPAEYAYTDITSRESFKKPLNESEFFAVQKFPFDISLDYKGGNKLSLYARENENGAIEVHAYQTQYTKPLLKCKRVFIGSDVGNDRHMLYALGENSNILAFVMPWNLKAESPLQSFIIESAKAWYVGGMDAITGFEEDLQTAMERSKQYYDNMNRERIEKGKSEQEKHEAEQKAKEIEKTEKIIANMSITGSEISGEDLVKAARFMEMELHPRTAGSLKSRICNVTIKDGGGISYSFYKTKSGQKVSKGTLNTIFQIINTAKQKVSA